MIKKLFTIYVVLYAFLSTLTMHIDADQEDVSDSDELFDQLYDAGAQLTEDYVPQEVLDQFEIPSYEDWKAFWQQLTDALESYSFEDLAWIQPQVHRAVKLLQSLPAKIPYADWLLQRLDYCDMAHEVVQAIPIQKGSLMAASKSQKSGIMPQRPVEKTVVPSLVNKQRTAAVQNPSVWKKKIAKRPKPKQAEKLIPRLKKVFVAEGIPPQWVWLAEVESTMNSEAESPVGAKGLFQLMPETANRFGLKTSPEDERLNPEKSARAAAKYLKILYQEFGSWSLALAAYNAGEGRIGRLLKKHNAKTFEEISFDLPVETRMYVPKVLAVVELREGMNPAMLPAPGALKIIPSIAFLLMILD